MGYTDPLLGVREWPATTTSWNVSRAGDDVVLTVSLVAQPGAAVPAPGTAPSEAAAVAAHQAARLAEAAAQLAPAPPVVAAELLSPLAPGGDGTPLLLPVREGTAPLRRYLAGATLHARAAAALLPASLDGCATLADAIAAFGVDAAALAAVNGDVRAGALLRPGQPLVVSAGAAAAEPEVVPDGEETLTQLAARLGTSPAALLADNAPLALATPSRLVIPGAVALPTDGVRVPYTIAPGETLAGVAALFATDAPALAEDSRSIVGVLAPGRTVAVTVDGQRFATVAGAGDALDTVLERLHSQQTTISLADLASAIADDPLALAPDALLACPPPRLTSGAVGASGAADPLTAAGVAGAYRVEGVAFAEANAALVGVLEEGVTLIASDGAAAERTVARDTLNAVLGRFAARGIAVKLPALLAENAAVPLYRAGGRALLPPPLASVSAGLGAAAGPFAQPAFRLTATLRLRRDPAVVDPTLATPGRDGPVERADTTIPAPSGRRGGAQGLDAFAEELLAVLPALRVATAGAADDDRGAWAVDFGAGGIAHVALTGGATYAGGSSAAPRSFALRPLYPRRQSRANVPVPTLTSSGALGDETPRSFADADVETWARVLLADLDRFACAAGVSAQARDDLDRLRERLGPAVAQGLAPVLAGGETRTEDHASDARAEDRASDAHAGDRASDARAEDRASDAHAGDRASDARADDARAAAAARLVHAATDDGLAAAYGTTLAVQYDTAARSPYPSPPAPTARLHGSVSAHDAAATFAGAHVRLDPTPGCATLLLTVADPAARRALDAGQLAWVPDAIELYGEAPPNADADDALARRRLAFARPLAGAYATAAVAGDLGSPTLPIPLRALPAPPVVIAQEATPTHAGEQPSLRDAGRWTFALTYSHEHAPHDELSVRASFDVPGPLDERMPLAADAEADAERDLAVALFRYATLSGELRERIAAPGDSGDALARTVVELVEPVVAAWKAHWDEAAPLSSASVPAADAPAADALAGSVPPPAGNDDPSETYDLRVRVAWEPDAERLAAVTLSLPDPTALPSPTGAWPEVAWRDDDGTITQLAADPGGPRDGRLRYAPPPASTLTRGSAPTLRIAWTSLPVAATQNARARVSVRRNEALVASLVTNAAFVTETAAVAAPGVTAPLLRWEQELPADGADLTAAIASALRDLFGEATGPPLGVRLEYGESLGAAGLRSWLPVALVPDQPLSPAISTAIGDVAASWLDGRGPSPDGAAWGLSLTLSSDLPRRASRPLLVVDRLLYVPPR